MSITAFAIFRVIVYLAASIVFFKNNSWATFALMILLSIAAINSGSSELISELVRVGIPASVIFMAYKKIKEEK